MKIAALMLVKEHSKRLPGKNLKDFRGKPMFIWNLEKCVSIFEDVYVSSDSFDILSKATLEGAKPIHREQELCGDCPDIPVFQHALSKMPNDIDAIVAVHADTPTIEKNLIIMAKKILEMGVPEVMTCHSMFHRDEYKKQCNYIKGSIRGMTRERLENYPNAYMPKPEFLLVDTSIEVETIEDYKKALCQ